MMSAIKNIFRKLFGDISVGTVVRTLCFFLALANQVLNATGHSPLPITNDQVNALVTTGATVIFGLIAWWKNNSFTPAAIKADKELKALKGK